MIAIANNISTRKKIIYEALKYRESDKQTEERIKSGPDVYIKQLAKECVNSGAEILDVNLQQRYDTPETMEFFVNTIQEVVDNQLCLSAYNTDTLEAGLKACKKTPIINHVSLDTTQLQGTLPLAAKYNAEVILFPFYSGSYGKEEDILRLSGILVGAANEAGIPNERIYIDPGVLHITSETGQRYAKALTAIIPALREAFDPPVRTTCWINNISAGADRKLRRSINNTFLAVISSAGLSAAFIDVLDLEIMRTLRLINILVNGEIYANGAIQPKISHTHIKSDYEPALR